MLWMFSLLLFSIFSSSAISLALARLIVLPAQSFCMTRTQKCFNQRLDIVLNYWIRVRFDFDCWDLLVVSVWG